jgi:O-antigen/teichoic acid export membrane protein
VKQKDFIFNISLLLFLNLLIKPFWVLGIDIGVQNSIGAQQYGLYFAVFNFTFLFNMLLDMGVTNFNNRNIARHNQLLTKHISGIISLKMLLAVLYLVISFLAAFLIGYKDLQLKILFWAGINQILNSFILYLRSNISALLYFKTDSILSVLDRFLMIIFCSILLWGNVTPKPFQIEWFLYAQTAAYIISIMIAFAIVFNKAKPIKLTWNFTFFRAIIKKSFPFAILYLLMSFYNRIDSVMIERLLPDSIASYQTGIYASVFRLLDSLVMIAYLFSVILLPLFSKMLKNKENLIPIIKSSFTLLFFFSISVVVILITYRVPVLQLLYKEHIMESASVFKILIPCLIPFSFTYIFGTLLTANGNMRLLNISAIAGIFVNIIVNIILIPLLQAKGAAIASLSTQTIVCVLQVIIAFRMLKIPLKTIPYLNCGLFVIALLFGNFLINHYFNFQLGYMLLITTVYAGLIALMTNLIPITFIKNLLKTKNIN